MKIVCAHSINIVSLHRRKEQWFRRHQIKKQIRIRALCRLIKIKKDCGKEITEEVKDIGFQKNIIER